MSHIGLPVKRVLLAGLLETVVVSGCFLITSVSLFPNQLASVVLQTWFLIIAFIIICHAIYDNDYQKRIAFEQKVLAESTSLVKSCEQEASNARKQKLIEFIHRGVFDPIRQVKEESDILRTEWTKNHSQNETDKATTEYIKRLNDCSNVAYKTLSQTFDLVNIETGSLIFIYYFCEFTTLFDLKESILSQFDSKNIKLVTNFDDRLKNMTVRVDIERFSQVIELFIEHLLCCSSSDTRNIFIDASIIKEMESPEKLVGIRITMKHDGECKLKDSEKRDLADLSVWPSPLSYEDKENASKNMLGLVLAIKLVEKGFHGQVISINQFSSENSDDNSLIVFDVVLGRMHDCDSFIV